MTLALAGLTIALRSWLGLIGVFLLFLPSEVYRAKLEERALLHKFGGKWENYAARTGFILPLINRSFYRNPIFPGSGHSLGIGEIAHGSGKALKRPTHHQAANGASMA